MSKFPNKKDSSRFPYPLSGNRVYPAENNMNTLMDKSILSKEIGELRKEIDRLIELNAEISKRQDMVEEKKVVEEEKVEKMEEDKHVEMKHEQEKHNDVNHSFDGKNKDTDLRVISFKSSPLTNQYLLQAQEFKRLEEENQSLKARIHLLEQGNDADITRQVEEGIKSCKENEKLKKQLETAENKLKSFVDAFKKTSKEFREVCYMLTGFKIDVLKENIYRFSHIYADSAEDNLLFKLQSDGTVNILANEYSAKLDDLVQTYLNTHDSFPGFLAALTLELFQKQTHYVG